MSISRNGRSDSGWESYPKNAVTSPPFFDDREAYYQDLQKRSDKLFARDETKLESFVYQTCRGVQAAVITDLRTLEKLFDGGDQSAGGHTFVYLHQKTSWDRFLVTYEIFARILTFYDAFPPFLDYVHAFGAKSREEDENFGGYHYRIYDGVAPGTSQSWKTYEFCYHIRYVEKHGRASSSPWSIRQVAIYQQYDARTKSSRWLLLQPSEKIKSTIASLLSSHAANSSFSGDPVLLHLVFFTLTERNWRSYINHLEENFVELENKALYARVGGTAPRPFDFPVTFADSQKIQRLRRTLLKVFAILESSLEVTHGYKTLHKDLSLQEICGNDPSHLAQVEQYTAQLRTHRRSVNSLLERSKVTLKMYWQILGYRNDETISEITAGMRQNSDTMRVVAIATKRDTEIAGKLAEKAQRDSRSVKVLTFIAMLYLPATLVATVFSSNFIEVDGGGSTSFGFSRFWLFPVVTLVLMAATMVPVIFLERRLARGKGKTLSGEV